jgi:hypothetical protein
VFLLDELRAVTRPRWLKAADSVRDIAIALHLRHGDFAIPSCPEDLVTKGGIRTPISWFIRSLKLIRDAIGFPAEAVIFSDGTDRDLAELLDCDNVRLVRTGSAISDLLALGRAKVLIGSGGSSFSAWASYLGQMPTITHPGQPLSWFKLSDERGILGEFDPSNPNAVFLDAVSSLFLATRPDQSRTFSYSSN